jgi:methionyl-tRNA formyltransferase
MKIVFFGTPSIAANILDHLLKNGVEVVAVVTKPDKPQGRSQKMQSSAVKSLVKEHYPHIPVLEPVKVSTSEWQSVLEKYQADLFVVVAYGEIIRQNILNIPKKGCINVHASLLPKYRGAAPIHRAIMNGEKESGICIMEMVLALDAGDVLHVEKVAISESMTTGELEKELEHLGFLGLMKTLENFDEKMKNNVKQEESLVTYAHKLTTQECQIDWNKAPLHIHNLVRGVTPYPGAWCFVQFEDDSNPPARIKIKKTSLSNLSLSGVAGQVFIKDKQRLFAKADDGSLEILEVQLEGKKAMSSVDFLKGYKIKNFL